MEKVRSKDNFHYNRRRLSSVSSWKQSHVIIYDPATSKLQAADISEPEIGYMKKVHAPGRSSRVKLYLNVGQEQNQIKTYLAKVDLGQLGSHVRWQRFCGNIDSIYVKGKEGSEPVSGC